MTLRVLGFEPFDGLSHMQVRASISRHSSHDWQWVTRPPRAWKWRMMTGAWELVAEAKKQEFLDPPPDVVFATSLLDAASLRAAMPPGNRDIPIVLYMHENQVVYPRSEQGDSRDARFALTNLNSMLAADAVIFNSRWNMESCIDGLMGLLRMQGDCGVGDVEAIIRGRSCVVWPPVEEPPEEARVLHNTGSDGATRVLWPHRWEHDKGPEELLELARSHSEASNLRWIILGERFGTVPPAMETFLKECAGRIDHAGFVESRDEYWQWLEHADWVLSTAQHEFFGIAVVEALMAGCLPWLPERLSYPELLPDCARGLSPMHLPCDPQAVHEAIVEHLSVATAKQAVAQVDQAIGSSLVGC